MTIIKSQDAIPATKSRSGQPPTTSKHTADVPRQELLRNRHLSASELKEMHQDLLGNVSVRCIQYRLKAEEGPDIPSRCAASKPISLHMKKNCLQFALRYLYCSVDDWKRSHGLIDPPFSTSPSTNKGHLSAKTSKCDQSRKSYYHVLYCSCIIDLYEILHCFAMFYTDFLLNVIKDRESGNFLRA